MIGRRPRSQLELVFGAVLVAGVVAVAVVSMLWTPYDPSTVDASSRLLGPQWSHPLGTDNFGRDIVSQLMAGSRITVLVGVVAVGMAVSLGVPLGIFSGLSRHRWVDAILMRLCDVWLAFPALLLAIIFAAVFGGSTVSAMAAIGIATAPYFARVARSGTKQVLAYDYVTAARVSRRSTLYIGIRHVLPNIVNTVVVQMTASLSTAVLAEAALSYLGLGTPPPTPSWGRMLQESQNLVFTHPVLLVWPAAAIMLVVLGFNLCGDGFRNYVDRRQGRSE